MKAGFKITLVIAAVWLCLVAFEKLYDFGLKHNQNIKLSAIGRIPANTALLVHGPCEPLWMISPALLDSHTRVPSYNLALSHSDFADNYLHLHLYLKSHTAPKYLWLYITPESMDRRYNTFNSYRFAPYLHDSVVAGTVKENDPDYFAWCFVPFMRYAYYGNKITFDVLQGYKHYFAGRKEAYYPNGFEPPANRVWGNHAAEFAELYHKNTLFSWDTLREKYLLKTIRLAQQHGVKVYLYESPVFYGALAYQPNRHQILQKIKRLADKQRVPLILFDQLQMAHDKSLYISTLNFNLKGIRQFNDTLGRYIRQQQLTDSLCAPY